MHIENAMLHNFSSCAWINPSILFVRSLFFPPTPLIVFLVAMKKCEMPLSEPLVDHRPRSKMFRRGWCVGGPRGYRHIRRTRHTGHCWRSRDELISDVLLWTSTYGRAKAGRPTRTYVQQLCEDTGCSPEDLPEAMNDREKWRERLRDIRAGGTTWWWWLFF